MHEDLPTGHLRGRGRSRSLPRAHILEGWCDRTRLSLMYLRLSQESGSRPELAKLLPVDLEQVLTIAWNDTYLRASVPGLPHSSPVVGDLLIGRADIPERSLQRVC
jgi:hypothetical protein